MTPTPVSTEGLRADLTQRGFSASAIDAMLVQAQETGEYKAITFTITADDDAQQFYVQNFPQSDWQSPTADTYVSIGDRWSNAGMDVEMNATVHIALQDRRDYFARVFNHDELPDQRGRLISAHDALFTQCPCMDNLRG